jgi:hypothetical protein
MGRVVAGPQSECKPILAIGGGLGFLGAVIEDQEIIWLTNPESGVRTLPMRTRAEPWRHPPRIPLADKSAGIVAIFDELAMVAPAQRTLLLQEVARVASDAVVIACPFDGSDVNAAMLRISDAHRGMSGHVHPRLARALDLGLPDLTATVSALGQSFANVHAEPFDSLTAWEQSELISALSGENGAASNGFEVALAAVDRGPRLPTGPCFRHVVVASSRALRPALENDASASLNGGMTAVDPIQLLSYIRTTRYERQFSALADEIDHKIDAAVGRLSTECSEAISRLTAERDTLQRDFERLVRNLSDDLQDLETECQELRVQNEQLSHEREAKAALLHQTEVRAAHLQHVVHVMEATRGWKMLVRIRRIRERLRGRFA